MWEDRRSREQQPEPNPAPAAAQSPATAADPQAAKPAPGEAINFAAEPVRIFAAEPAGETISLPAVGVQGLAAGGGWENWEHGPYSQFPPKRQLVMEYYLMARLDPTIKTALRLLTTLILGKLGEYHHDDPNVQERGQELLGRIQGGPRAVVSQLLSGLWAGFAIPQLQWQTEGSEWYIASTDLLHPFTFFKRGAAGTDATGRPAGEGIALDRKTGRVEEVKQFSSDMGGGGGELTLTREQIIYWPAFRELREEVYGVSLLQAARPSWFAKVKLSTYWNTLCEKTGMETPVFFVPPGGFPDPETQQEISWAQWVMKIWATIKPGMGLALPGDPDRPWNMEVLAPKGDGTVFAVRDQHLDADLWKAMLFPRLLFEEPEHGTRAQSETVMDLMLELVDGLRSELGGDNSGVLIEQLVRPLLLYNVGEQEHYGTWAWDPMRDADLERLARILETVERARSQAAMGGRTEPADERKWRETFGEVYADADEIATASPDGKANRGGAGADASVRSAENGNGEGTEQQMRMRYR